MANLEDLQSLQNDAANFDESGGDDDFSRFEAEERGEEAIGLEEALRRSESGGSERGRVFDGHDRQDSDDIPADLMQQAAMEGISHDEARALGSNGLRTALSIAVRSRLQHSGGQSQPPTTAASAGTTAEDDLRALSLELGELDDQTLGEGAQNYSRQVKQQMEAVVKRLNSVAERLQAQENRFRDGLARQRITEFEGAMKGLGDDYKDVLGAGALRSMTAAQKVAADQLYSLANMIQDRSPYPVDMSEATRQAAMIIWPQKIVNQTRRETTEAINRQRQQTTTPPTSRQRNSGRKSSPEADAIALARKALG